MTTTYSDSVSDEIRAQMARQKVTQQALADKIAISQQSLSRRLTGRAGWTVEEVANVASALGVPLRQLMPDRIAS